MGLECAPDNASDNLRVRPSSPKGYIRPAQRRKATSPEEAHPTPQGHPRHRKSSTAASTVDLKTMDATRSFITGFLLLFLLGFHPSASHPVSLSPAKELASMEELLERLEEKIALMEDLQGSPEYEEAETPREDGLRFSEGDSGPQMMGPRVEAVPFISDRTSVLKRMRGLQAAKSTRESGCFGRRLDRIGSVSGMGCRGSRRD